MTTQRSAALLVFGTLLAGCSRPQPAVNADCPSEAPEDESGLPELSAANHRKAVESVVVLLGVEEQLERCATDMIAAQVRLNPGIEPYRDLLEQFLRKRMSWTAVGPEVVNGYMERVSQREAEELAEFLSTPLGRKWAKAQPELNQRMLAFGESILLEHRAELNDAVADRNRQIRQEEAESTKAE